MKEYSETIPIQYEEGKAAFMGMDIMVDERAFIPRPETELLVNVVGELIKKKGWIEPLILEIGTGSGAVSIGLAKLIKSCRVVASDISLGSLEVARGNMERFNCEDTIELVESDIFSAFVKGNIRRFNCIVSNPPYVSKKDYEKLDAWVKAEPRLALYGGRDGMNYLDRLAEEAKRFLLPDGFIAVEIGYDQAEKVKKKFKSCGLKKIKAFKDFNGFQRVIVGWENG